ncbi:MAG: hypothetical protein SFX73_12150 [Kofleriaceae bacterium]|nr:hypothetical protein [Kofleriaceae bacterium]
MSIARTEVSDLEAAPSSTATEANETRGPGVVMLERTLAAGGTPGDLARVIQQHRGEEPAMMMFLQQTCGNAFTQRLIEDQPGEVGETASDGGPGDRTPKDLEMISAVAIDYGIDPVQLMNNDIAATYGVLNAQGQWGAHTLDALKVIIEYATQGTGIPPGMVLTSLEQEGGFKSMIQHMSESYLGMRGKNAGEKVLLDTQKEEGEQWFSRLSRAKTHAGKLNEARSPFMNQMLAMRLNAVDPTLKAGLMAGTPDYLPGNNGDDDLSVLFPSMKLETKPTDDGRNDGRLYQRLADGTLKEVDGTLPIDFAKDGDLLPGGLSGYGITRGFNELGATASIGHVDTLAKHNAGPFVPLITAVELHVRMLKAAAEYVKKDFQLKDSVESLLANAAFRQAMYLYRAMPATYISYRATLRQSLGGGKVINVPGQAGWQSRMRAAASDARFYRTQWAKKG